MTDLRWSRKRRVAWENHVHKYHYLSTLTVKRDILRKRGENDTEDYTCTNTTTQQSIPLCHAGRGRGR